MALIPDPILIPEMPLNVPNPILIPYYPTEDLPFIISVPNMADIPTAIPIPNPHPAPIPVPPKPHDDGKKGAFM